MVSCKNDSECDHSNCQYCTSAGYCRSIGISYCEFYDCGIGDGSCLSYDDVTRCNSNLTCGTDHLLDYHPLLAHCLDSGNMKYRQACVPKGI